MVLKYQSRLMMISKRKLASAMGGKTTRACDNCIKKRARWYCPADDAFLCQNCDASLHLANPLPRRHERVCLKTSSPKQLSSTSSSDDYFLNLESPASISSVSVPLRHRDISYIWVPPICTTTCERYISGIVRIKT